MQRARGELKLKLDREAPNGTFRKPPAGTSKAFDDARSDARPPLAPRDANAEGATAPGNRETPRESLSRTGSGPTPPSDDVDSDLPEDRPEPLSAAARAKADEAFASDKTRARREIGVGVGA